MKVLAPAKINLYLKILGKRPDGYHDLETLMCPLALADEIEIEEKSSGIELEVPGAPSHVPTGPDNLVWKAAQAVLDEAKIKKGVRMVLHKKVPTGGGLAGGSSDAAAVLLAVNKLFNAPLPFASLEKIASGLGSDINFFLQPLPAVCTGRGEKVSPLALKNLPWVVLINPGFGVPTPWAYKTYAQHPSKGTEGKTFEWEKSVTLRNDLEPAVFSKYLWIAETKSWLQKNPLVLDSLMSGSGATVFALVHDEKDAKTLARQASEYLGSSTWIHVTRAA